MNTFNFFALIRFRSDTLRTLSIVTFAFLAHAPSFAVDPLALHLPFDRIVPERSVFRASQINRFDRDAGYHFGLAASWNPDFFSETRHRLNGEIGAAIYSGSSQESELNSYKGLWSMNLSLLYEYRMSETISLEMGPGLALWHSFSDNLSQKFPQRRDFQGGRMTFRIVDRFQPALAGIFDRITLGIFVEGMGVAARCIALEISIGMKF